MSNLVNYQEKGIVFNMQRFSVHDGPGVRTIVFLKGCPLSCKWCSNPESQNRNPQMMFNSKNCNKCGRCIKVCSQGAIDFNNPNRIDRKKCTNCGKCEEICFPGAMVMSGKDMTVEQVIKELKKEAIQFRKSNGGITLSGGEPLMQPEYSTELLKACKSLGWHTAMETTAFASKEVINKVIPWVDLVLLDIKSLDSYAHINNTGVSNQSIIDNIKTIAQIGTEVIVRVPVIPGFNADRKSIEDIANFTKSLQTINEIHLLPYHKLGKNKYECIGKEYKMLDEIESPSHELMMELKEVVENIGIKCNIGGH